MAKADGSRVPWSSALSLFSCYPHSFNYTLIHPQQWGVWGWGVWMHLSAALSLLLHREGAGWDPKASERLQEVQFIIFNGEEQEVAT